MSQENTPADDFARDPDYLEWKQRFESREKKVRLAPNVKHCLDILRQDGADADKVLGLVTLVVPDDHASRIAIFKSQQKKLDSVASRLERVSKEVEATFSNPSNSSAFIGFMFFPELVKEFPSEAKLKRLSSASKKRILPTLNLLRAEARIFGKMSRIYSPFNRDNVLERLIRHVKESTGQFHDECLADLLQAAHDELGVNATFSAEQLRILRRRNFPTLTRNRRRSNLFEDALREMLGTPPSGLDKTGAEN